MIWLFLWIGCALLAAYIAGTKRRSTWWALLGFLLGPIGVIIVALLPKLEGHEPVQYAVNAAGQREAIGGTTACPFCAETIKAAAIVCKHCGRDLHRQAEAIITDDMADRIARASRKS
jgi:hypothetical protein